MTRTEELAGRWSAVMMGNYRTPPVALARGEGSVVWDVDGREYTDLLGGGRRHSRGDGGGCRLPERRPTQRRPRPPSP